LGLYFWRILDPAAVQDCTKFSSLTNVLIQLVRAIINRICYQRYEKRRAQQKNRPNVNVCGAEENLEEELLCINKPVFDHRFISNKHTHMFLFVTQAFWVFIV